MAFYWHAMGFRDSQTLLSHDVFKKLGFLLVRWRWDTATSVMVIVPFWAVQAGPMLLAAAAYWRLRRVRQARRRRREGRCVVCGYDLRASTERCPECGTAM